jgi:hypothetical protein
MPYGIGTCRKCGSKFERIHKNQKKCLKCIVQEKEKVHKHFCLWCKTQLFSRTHGNQYLPFCSDFCKIKYGIVSRKIILVFPSGMIEDELSKLKTLGEKYTFEGEAS